MRLVSRRARSSLRGVSSTKPGTPPNRPSAAAAARTGPARARTSGTRCSRFIFMRMAGMVHTRPAVSTSVHSASRTSPHRAADSTRNSNARLAPGSLDEDRTVSISAATCCWWPRNRPDSVAGVVGAAVHGDGPLQHGADAPPHRWAVCAFVCQIGACGNWPKGRKTMTLGDGCAARARVERRWPFTTAAWWRRWKRWSIRPRGATRRGRCAGPAAVRRGWRGNSKTRATGSANAR